MVKKWDVKKIKWDEIFIRHPLCHMPLPFERVIHDRFEQEEIEEIVKILRSDDPVPVFALTEYFELKISMIEDLIKSGRIDVDIGKMAQEHYGSHIEEIKAITGMRG
jgi:hypothetical protein